MAYHHNFSAGPGILPKSVVEEAGRALVNFADTGLSILEISHRTKPFEAVVAEAEQLVRDLLHVKDDYAVTFLQGGASLQFAMVPYNLLTQEGTAAYVNTGVWATKAIKEAKMLGKVNVLATSEAENFNHIPKDTKSLPTPTISTAQATTRFTAAKCRSSRIARCRWFAT